jgi:SNF2 family DNA or RNA helicase
MRRITQFKWVPKPDANDTVHAQMQPSIRYTLDQIKELPPTVYVDRDVQLSAEATTAYKTLFDKMRLSTNAGKSITAVNEGVLQNKLMQVACGYIYTDDGQVHTLDNSGRLAALKETIDETERKVIVFVPYVHALKGVSDYLRGKGYDVATVHGETPMGQRNKVFTSFQSAPSPRVIVAHPQCMAHGLTLTEANLIVWYAPVQSLEIYEQANARIVRPGQTHKTIIAHLRGTAVERLAYNRLRLRAKMQGLLLALFRDQEVEF